MFTIITNYKKLFLLTLRSEFAGGNPEISPIVDGQKDINETTIDESLKKMRESGTFDIRILKKIKDQYETEKSTLNTSAKQKIESLLKEVNNIIFNKAKEYYRGLGKTRTINLKKELNLVLGDQKLDIKSSNISLQEYNTIVEFQRKYDIQIDGIIGTGTIKKINELKKAPAVENVELPVVPAKIETSGTTIDIINNALNEINFNGINKNGFNKLSENQKIEILNLIISIKGEKDINKKWKKLGELKEKFKEYNITIDEEYERQINDGLKRSGYKGISKEDFLKFNNEEEVEKILELITSIWDYNKRESKEDNIKKLEKIFISKKITLLKYDEELLEVSLEEVKPVETSKDTIAELEKQYSEKIDKLDNLVNDGKDYRYIQQQGSEKVFRIPERYFNGAKNPETVMYIASKVIGKEGTSSVERLISEANLGDIIGKKQGLELIVELNKVLSNNNKNIISINQMILSSEGLSKFKKVLSRTISLNYWNTPGNSRTDKEEFKSEIKDKKTEDERNAEKIHENYNIDTVSKSFIKELENLGLHKKMDENEKGEFLTNINEKPELRKILLSININSEKFNDLNDSRKVIQDIENNKDKSSVEKKLLKNSFKRDEDDYIKSFTNNKNLINKVKEYFENNKKGAFIVKDGNYIFDDKALDEAVKGNGVISGKIKVGKEDKEIVQSVTEASLEKINEMFKNLKFDESKIKALEGQRVPLSGNSNQGEQLYVKNGKIYIIGEYKKVGLIKSALITTGNNLDTQTAREIYIAAGASLLTAALIKGVKWKNLDPGKIKWSKIDPGKIKWSKIDPSKLIKDIDIDLSMSNVAKVGLGTYLGTSATLNYEIANLEAELDLSKGKEEASKILGTDIEDFKLNNKVQTTLNSIAERNYEIMDFDGKEYGVTFNKPLEVKYNNGKVIIYSIKVNQKGEILSGEFAFDKGVLSMESDKINIEKNNNLGINFNQLFIGMENGKKVVPDKLNFQNLNGKIEK